MALAYSARFRRCSAGAPGIRMQRRRAIERGLQLRREAIERRRDRLRRAAWRHHARAQLAHDFFPRCRMLAVDVRRDRTASSDRPPALRALVVTGDAVPLDESRVGRRCGRLCGADCVGPRRSLRIRGEHRDRRGREQRGRHSQRTVHVSALRSLLRVGRRRAIRQPLEQRNRRRLRDGRVVARKTPCAQRSGVRPSLSLTSSRAPCVARNSMMSSDPRLAAPCTRLQAHRVGGVDVDAQIETELHGLEFSIAGDSLKVSPIDPVHAGGGHQRVRAVKVVIFGSAPSGEQQRITGTSAGLRGADERRLTGEVDPRASPSGSRYRRRGRKLLHAGVHVGAAIEQRLDELERGRAIDAVLGWDVPLRAARLRMSTAAQSGVRPHQSLRSDRRRARGGAARRRSARW